MGAVGSHQQGVSVRRALSRNLTTDDAVGAGTIVDDHRLAPRFSELLAECARKQIGRSARSNRYDDADRLRRIECLPVRAQRHCKKSRRRCKMPKLQHILGSVANAVG